MASSQSYKYSGAYRCFVSEPMGNKLVTAVPGIGKVTGASMNNDGIYSAKQLYGQYLMDPDNFQDYVRSHGANKRIQATCYNAEKDWDHQHN